MADPEITLKIKGLSKTTETQHYQYLFDQAYTKMLADPTDENLNAFHLANKQLWEVRDSYRIGLRLRLAFVLAHPISPREIYTRYSETKQFQRR